MGTYNAGEPTPPGVIIPAPPSASGASGTPSRHAAEVGSSSTTSERTYRKSVRTLARGRVVGPFSRSIRRAPFGDARVGSAIACSSNRSNIAAGASATRTPSSTSASRKSTFVSSSASGYVASRGVIHFPPSARVCITFSSARATHSVETTTRHGGGGVARGSKS